ncbi:HD domain-containing protein [Herbaspirillum lusitanum]|uniref:HD domain-containing protein n=1 Tax=Herbaspirillum lusitanum TaxID=213312 RepID=A0ABW9ADZ1_9BURK
MTAHNAIASALFSPQAELAAILLPFAFSTAEAHVAPVKSDGSHDLSHLQRVWKNVCAIQAQEGGALDVLLAATLLHDCVQVEKNSPLRAQASRLSGERAAGILRELDWSQSKVEATAHAIAAHSFSAAVNAETLEARILQDADRLDAIGMVGAARCFYTAGRMGSALYDPADPLARSRELDDRRFALDHFFTKLLTLSDGFKTSAGAALASKRQQRLQRFVDDMLEEI